MSDPIWIVRDYLKCSGCRRCELACSMHHEDWMWPESSRIRVFMPFPGVEVPHFCAQCADYPCVDSCPEDALSVDEETSAVLVDRDLCTSCGVCVKACPGQVPFLHPGDNKATICDLCEGDPECVKVCQEAGYNALQLVHEEPNVHRKLFSMHPIVVAKDLAVNMFGGCRVDTQASS
jgi:Fe-S-cluster-containing hydrogenase component 2